MERPGDGSPREQKLCDWLYGQILHRILRGEYPPESRLPPGPTSVW